jgi:hypothetical protein
MEPCLLKVKNLHIKYNLAGTELNLRFRKFKLVGEFGGRITLASSRRRCPPV